MSARVVAVVQARLGSSRYYGKVLARIGGQTMLTHVLARAKAIPGVGAVIVTTTPRSADDAIVNLCRGAGVRWSRGQVPLASDPKRNDVLAGYATAAEESGARVVVRLTSDCPLLDQFVAGSVLAAFRAAPGCDYASNVHPPSWYDGTDVEVVSAAALRRAAAEACAPEEREHVTPYIFRRSDLFRAVNVSAPAGEEAGAAWKLSVDTGEDMERVRCIWAALPRAVRRGEALLTWRAVVAAYLAHQTTDAIRAVRLYGRRSATARQRGAYLAGAAAARRAEARPENPWSRGREREAPLATAWALGWEDGRAHAIREGLRP